MLWQISTLNFFHFRHLFAPKQLQTLPFQFGRRKIRIRSLFFKLIYKNKGNKKNKDIVSGRRKTLYKRMKKNNPEQSHHNMQNPNNNKKKRMERNNDVISFPAWAYMWLELDHFLRISFQGLQAHCLKSGVLWAR